MNLGLGSVIAPSNSRNNNIDNHKYCDACQTTILRDKWGSHLRSNLHKNNACIPVENKANLKCIQGCFGSRIVTYRLENKNESIMSPQTFLNNSSILLLLF